MPADRRKHDAAKPFALEELLNELPAARRARIKKETGRLAAEYRLGKSREALSMTEAEMAGLLEEWRVTDPGRGKGSDLTVATLCRYIEALGGKLRLGAEFPEQPVVRLDVPAGSAGVDRAAGDT